MLKPNDLPLVCLPVDLSDKAAAAIVEFLHELSEAFERHYAAQLMRHYHDRPTEITPRDVDDSDTPF